MPLEQQCASLELSKRLVEVAKEKGFELSESLFWWDTRHINLFTKEDGRPFRSVDIIPAYNVAELGEISGEYTETNLAPDTLRHYITTEIEDIMIEFSLITGQPQSADDWSKLMEVLGIKYGR